MSQGLHGNHWETRSVRHEARAASPMERARKSPNRAEQPRTPTAEGRDRRETDGPTASPNRLQPRDFLVAAFEDACAQLHARHPVSEHGDATASRSIDRVAKSRIYSGWIFKVVSLCKFRFRVILVGLYFDGGFDSFNEIIIMGNTYNEKCYGLLPVLIYVMRFSIGWVRWC